MALLWFANMIYRYFQDDVKWSNTVGVDTVLMRFYKYTNKQPTVVLDYDGVILYVNRAFAEKLKYTKLDLIGKNYTKFLVGEYIAESAEVWNEGKDIVVLKDYKNEYYDSEGNKVEMHWEVCINYNNFKKSVCRLKE